MNFRIATVSFLNSVPLMEWFATSDGTGHQIISQLPSKMSDLLKNDDADVALLPVVESFRGQSGGLFAGTGIACHGNVDSVKLFSSGPLNKIQRVLADRGSRSSVALTEVLLGELQNIKPRFVQIEPRPGHTPADNEAILVIGDRCFEYEKQLIKSGRTNIMAHDLGGMWFDMTGLPFVFAVWALSPGFKERMGDTGVNALSKVLAAARDYGLANLNSLADREATNGRLGYLGQSSPEAIVHYFSKSLVYKLGDREISGMRHFHKLCIKYGLVPDQPLPRIL